MNHYEDPNRSFSPPPRWYSPGSENPMRHFPEPRDYCDETKLQRELAKQSDGVVRHNRLEDVMKRLGFRDTNAEIQSELDAFYAEQEAIEQHEGNLELKD